jgi:Swiss Army Knife protein, DSP-PTPase phosphatase domain
VKPRYLPTLLGLLLIAIGIIERGWFLLAAWLGANFFVIGIAHAAGAHRIFGKRPDGSLPFWSWLLFLPLLLYTTAVWHLIRLISREPAHNAVSDNLVVGRRHLPAEVSGEFTNYIDLTAEFAEPLHIRRAAGYISFPVLDGSAPDPAALRHFLNGLRPGKTFIHCAQGHGRTGLFAAALLLQSGAAGTPDEALNKLRSVRPGIRLNTFQRRCLEVFASQFQSKRSES